MEMEECWWTGSRPTDNFPRNGKNAVELKDLCEQTEREGNQFSSEVLLPN
jgi:hypothetical protein